MTQNLGTAAGAPAAYWPDFEFGSAMYSAFPPTVSTISISTTAWVCFVGQVAWDDGGTHNIDSVGWIASGLTAATVEVSLQDISTSANSSPDGTIDQSVSVVNPANGYVLSTLGSARASVVQGTLLGIVFKCTSGSGGVVSKANATFDTGFPYTTISNNSGSTWSPTTSGVPICSVHSNDGAIGTLLGSFQNIAIFNSHLYNSTSNPKGYGIEFTPPYDIEAIGVLIAMKLAARTSDFTLSLFQGTSEIATFTGDGTQFYGTAACWAKFLWTSGSGVSGGKVKCSKDTLYRLMLLPTTSNNVTAYSFDVPTADHLNVIPGAGQATNYATRASDNSFNAATTTRRAMMSLILSQAVGGGGLLRHPGMNGGLPG